MSGAQFPQKKLRIVQVMASGPGTGGIERILKMLPFLVASRRCSVDIGANRGTYTDFLSRLTPHVFAYQPNPAIRRYLAAAADENVTVSGKALSDYDGEATLTIPIRGKRCSNNTGSLEECGTGGADRVHLPVSAGRLDDEPIRDVGFIKIDVEGHEPTVLRGATEVSLRDRPVMLVEILPEPTPLHREQTIRQVEAMGYQSFVMLNSKLVMLRSIDDGRNGFAGSDVSQRASNNFIFLPPGRRAA